MLLGSSAALRGKRIWGPRSRGEADTEERREVRSLQGSRALFTAGDERKAGMADCTQHIQKEGAG